MTGPSVRVCAREFFVDKFFIGTDGFDAEQGFSNKPITTEAVRAMAKSAKRRIILTDSSKFNRRGVVSLMPLLDIALVITDAVPENCRKALIESGVEIMIV